jgi:hypothetical protein
MHTITAAYNSLLTRSICVHVMISHTNTQQEHLPEVLAEMKQRCGHVKSIAPRVRQRPGAVKVGPILIM